MTWKIEIDSSKCAYSADHNTYCCYNDEPCEEENCPIRSTGWPPMLTGEPPRPGYYLVMLEGEERPYVRHWQCVDWQLMRKVIGWWHLPGGE